MNFYNEIDDGAAATLRELINRGLIAPGVVDQRSIEDITPNELKQYTQCHFFAGIGVWSLALRRAGWPDDKPVWTGSCPCQPFSAAGKGNGFDDERHLWPAWHHLISECKPDHIFGEQVASKDGLSWLDLVQSDLEAEGYAFGAVDLCAAGVGAPHIRQRLYFVADTGGAGLEGGNEGTVGGQRSTAQRGGSPVRLADADDDGFDARLAGNARSEVGARGSHGHLDDRRGAPGRLADLRGSGFEGPAGLPGRRDTQAGTAGDRGAGRMADTGRQQRQRGQDTGRSDGEDEGEWGEGGRDDQRGGVDGGRPGPTNGHWRVADWLLCRDGKWRPVEPGTFPLAHGAPARVGRLRGYGNAIVEQAAETFITSYLEARGITFDTDL